MSGYSYSLYITNKLSANRPHNYPISGKPDKSQNRNTSATSLTFSFPRRFSPINRRMIRRQIGNYILSRISAQLPPHWETGGGSCFSIASNCCSILVKCCSVLIKWLQYPVAVSCGEWCVATCFLSQPIRSL